MMLLVKMGATVLVQVETSRFGGSVKPASLRLGLPSALAFYLSSKPAFTRCTSSQNFSVSAKESVGRVSEAMYCCGSACISCCMALMRQLTLDRGTCSAYCSSMNGKEATRCACGSEQASGCNPVSCFIISIYFNLESLLYSNPTLFSFIGMFSTPLRKTFDNPEYLATSRKYDHKCVCQLCNCGKHRCPEKGVKFQAKTTNSQFYRPYQVPSQRREKEQQKVMQTHYDPQVIQSSYKTNFQPFKVEKERPVTHKSGYEPPKAKFQGESQYKKNYLPNRGKPQRFNTSPAKQYVPNPAKFEGSTTYARQFSPKKVENGTSYATFKKTNAPIASSPFQGQTSYATSFKPHKIEPNRPMTSRNNQYTPNPNRLQGQSRYREFYQPHKIQPKERCPTEYLPQRQATCSPGKDHLFFSAEKNRWQ